ncbi:myeloid leukemia factor 2-like isoform X2 [Liolophura sinensis]
MQRMESLFNDFPFQRRHRGMMGITDGREHHQQLQHRNNQLQPFGMFDSMFGNMFKNMRNMMADVQRGFVDVQNNPDSHCYTQSSFVSYSQSGNGAPKVYQASTSTRNQPGGIKETHRTLRDSESGVEKMSIGRHIQDRAYVMERSRNRKTGEEEQNQNFVNMDEGEAQSFDQEWREKTSHVSRGSRGVDHRSRRSQIPIRTQRSHGSAGRLALPSPVLAENTEGLRRDTRRHMDPKRIVGATESRRIERRRNLHTPRSHRDRD